MTAEIPAPTLRATEPNARSRAARRRTTGPNVPRGMRLGAAISLVPAAVLFALFFLLPLLVLLGSSFGTWDAVGFTFTGGKNFADMAQDPVFWTAMRNTLAYVGLGVFVQTPLSVLAGILLATRLRGWRVFRAIIFIPFVISGAAYALVFNLGLDPSHGFVNQLLGALGLPDRHDWLFSQSTALVSVAATFMFVLGLGMTLVMAEIVSIPAELYEAAELDGATGFQRQLYVTLPLLRSVIGAIVLLAILASLGFFDVPFILTSGGPNNATVTLALYGYRAYVNNSWGYSSAVGAVILILGLVFIVATRRIFRIGESR